MLLLLLPQGGCVIIAIISFTVGTILAPNVGYANTQSSLPETKTEVTAQVMLGVVSILLCVASFLLFVGSTCNVPILIEIYQWGALIYGMTTTVLYIIIASYSFFVHTNSATAGAWLTGLIIINIYLTSYFIIIANSLRMSILFLHSTEVLY